MTGQADPEAPAQKARWWQRSTRQMIAALAAFGIFGAVGTYVVNATLPDAAEKISGTEPLRFTVQTNPEGGGDGFIAAKRSTTSLDRTFSGVNNCDAFFAFAKRVGAVDVRHSRLHVLLEGRTRRDVAIIGMKARIHAREPSFDGEEMVCASAGSIDSIGVAFDLDETKPIARAAVDADDASGAPFFQDGKVIALKQGELQPIAATGYVDRGYVSWDLQLDVVVDGEKRTFTIDDNGKPFRTTGPAKVYRRYLEWVWYVQPPYLYVSALDREKSALPTFESAKARPCGRGTLAGPNTSCNFALAVRTAYSKRTAGKALSVTSDATSQTYTVECTGKAKIVCRGGDDASVEFEAP